MGERKVSVNKVGMEYREIENFGHLSTVLEFEEGTQVSSELFRTVFFRQPKKRTHRGINGQLGVGMPKHFVCLPLVGQHSLLSHA